MIVFNQDEERRFMQIKDDHAKRHTGCTADNCHTQWMIEQIESFDHKVANTHFLLELHRL